jgi:catechol 2,3-dioxygenase-like lactoylglutathione lyase family enzyme
VIDHIGINCADYPKSQAFYDTVLAVLGFSRQLDFGEAIGYGRDGKPTFWIAEGAGMGPNRENHIAFGAADENAVRAFHETALRLGAESSPASGRCPQHEPRLWPEYHPGYFGAFVRDPDGNNVEAVYHGA